MSLKDFLQEEKKYRKEQRAEQKKQKKQPLTRGQIVYKIVSIIFAIALVIGAFSYSCRALSGTSNWGQLGDLNSQVKQKLSSVPSEEEVLGDNVKIKESDRKSFVDKLLAVGIDYDGESKQAPTGDFELTSIDIGAYAVDFNKETGNNQKFEILSYKIYFGGEYFYEQSIAKFYLNKYFGNTDLPIMYVNSVSMIQIQSGSLKILSTTSTINNLNQVDSDQIMDALDKKTLVYSFESLANTTINGAINSLSLVTKTKMTLEDNKIKFVLSEK